MRLKVKPCFRRERGMIVLIAIVLAGMLVVAYAAWLLGDALSGSGSDRTEFEDSTPDRFLIDGLSPHDELDQWLFEENMSGFKVDRAFGPGMHNDDPTGLDGFDCYYEYDDPADRYYEYSDQQSDPFTSFDSESESMDSSSGSFDSFDSGSDW